MESIENTVHYCCVSKGSRLLYAYTNGRNEIENLAALCLERVPAFHKWYFHTMEKKTFGFLMEDEELVYFAIVDSGLGNPGVLQFLEHVRDEFKKVSRKGSRGSPSSFNFLNLQDQLVPVVHRLISSLPHPVGLSPSPSPSPSPSLGDANGQMEAASSTKAPLLGKLGKQEKEKKKKKMKDPVVVMRDIEMEEHRKSTDRGGGIKIESGNSDSVSQGGVGSSSKDLGRMRMIMPGGSQSIIRKKWCRHVRIVLAIDAAICLILFVIWLVICHGVECIR